MDFIKEHLNDVIALGPRRDCLETPIEDPKKETTTHRWGVIIIGPLKRKQLTMLDLSYMLEDMTQERTEERKNRFNGESVMLTKEEAKRHDELFMCEMLATLEDRTLGTGASKYWNKMREHLDWFMKHNAKAYMVLLD